MPKSENKKMTFESAAQRLEEIVALLEKGNSSLDESLGLYEEGVRLVKYCNDALDGAEKRIRAVVDNGDGTYTEKDISENV